MIFEIERTADNSQTLVHPVFGERYHSVHGAMQESMHVFIKNGLMQMPGLAEIRIFELGFGTGLNALLSCNYAFQNKVKISYECIEPFPVPQHIYRQLNFAESLDSKDFFAKMHHVQWEVQSDIHPFFSILKHEINFQDFESNNAFDLVYYDAFGPNTQPELWNMESLKQVFEMMAKNGVLVTYCAKGAFKRNLKEAGFQVLPLPGPPGKREMTKALKI